MKNLLKKFEGNDREVAKEGIRLAVAAVVLHALRSNEALKWAREDYAREAVRQADDLINALNS